MRHYRRTPPSGKKGAGAKKRPGSGESRRITSVLGIAAALVVALLLLSGCYVTTQGLYLLHYNKGAQKISRLLDREDLDLETRVFLEEVVRIKEFAVEEIGLKKNRNYTTYVELDKSYLVDVVTASKDDSFTPNIWKFPVVGEVPYKGFYRRKDAEKLAAELRKKNYDVWIRKVDTFSTLGFFTDPIYSYMMDYSVFRLADLLIHEQTHATIFLKDEVQFNEELANFVGTEGAFAYITARRGGAVDLRERIAAARKDRDRFYALMRDLYTRLDEVYTSEALSRAEKLEKKEEIIREFKTDLKKNYDAYFQTGGYRHIADREINNAFILSWKRYSQDLSLFYDVYDAYGGDLKRFMEVVLPVEEWDGDPKEYLRVLVE